MEKFQKIGCRIFEEMPWAPPELLKKVSGYSPPELCDGSIVYNAMDYQIKPMVITRKIVGQVITLKLMLGDSLLVTKAYYSADREPSL